MSYKKPRLHNIYSHMKSRCYNKNNDAYNYYGGRGVKVCDEWLNDPNIFYKWALENGYSNELTLDRIDVNGNYEPCNCRWVSRKVQMCNTRRNKFITYKGVTKTIQEWAEELRIKPRTLHNRLYRSKMDVDLAFKKDKLYGNKITYHGETRTVSQWAKIIGISESALYQRVFRRNIPLERAFQKECKK